MFRSGILIVLVLATAASAARGGNSAIPTAVARRQPMAHDIPFATTLVYDAQHDRVVRAGRDGRVARLHVMVGQYVERGQPLLTLDGGGVVAAPDDGTIMSEYVASGAAVTPKTAVCALADASRLWSYVFVGDDAAAGAYVGQRVHLRGDDGAEAEARVTRVLSWLPPGPHAVRVRIDVDNRRHALRPGQTVSGVLVGDATHAPAALAIPARAVVTVGGEKRAWVRDADGRFRPRALVLGRNGGDRVEVKSGLAEGDTVAVGDLELLGPVTATARAP